MAEDHTYFVGDIGASAAVWVHNDYEAFRVEYQNRFRSVHGQNRRMTRADVIRKAYDKCFTNGQINLQTVRELYTWLAAQGLRGANADACVQAGLANMELLRPGVPLANFAEVEDPTMEKQKTRNHCLIACATTLLSQLASLQVDQTALGISAGTSEAGTQFHKLHIELNKIDANMWEDKYSSAMTREALLEIVKLGPVIIDVIFGSPTSGANVRHAIIVDVISNDGIVTFRDPDGTSLGSAHGSTNRIHLSHLIELWGGNALRRKRS